MPVGDAGSERSASRRPQPVSTFVSARDGPPPGIPSVACGAAAYLLDGFRAVEGLDEAERLSEPALDYLFAPCPRAEAEAELAVDVRAQPGRSSGPVTAEPEDRLLEQPDLVVRAVGLRRQRGERWK